jgi:hypothetical protein
MTSNRKIKDIKTHITNKRDTLNVPNIQGDMFSFHIKFEQDKRRFQQKYSTSVLASRSNRSNTKSRFSESYHTQGISTGMGKKFWSGGKKLWNSWKKFWNLPIIYCLNLNINNK